MAVVEIENVVFSTLWVLVDEDERLMRVYCRDHPRSYT
jgi:hypothetical protein